ncbi:MAG: hypothetical protein M3Z95_00270, partial [Actinomycetota bacterium]|nr:hypothetical protein [Actinomycetota bacterium]
MKRLINILFAATHAPGASPKSRHRRATTTRHAVGRVPLAVTASIMTTLFVLAWGATASLAADYQDAKHNVCEGSFTSPGCAQWGSHVTGSENVALGDAMMNNLTSGNFNIALD